MPVSRTQNCGADIVVHCAAIAGIDTVIQRPVNTMRVNMVGAANVLETVSSNLPKCQRIICFSTSEVFGQYAFRSAETDNTVVGKVGEARWTYAVSKGLSNQQQDDVVNRLREGLRSLR